MKKIKKKKAGFSLIEVLFATLFLTVIVFGVIKLQTSNMILSHSRQLELKAHTYAAQGLEIVSALGYDALTACPGPNCSLSYDESSETWSIDQSPDDILEGGFFSRHIQYSQGALTGDVTRVTVYVEWKDSTGDDHSVSASRILFKK